jgi:glycosyltransferase involved in cell wall biosynthesis
MEDWVKMSALPVSVIIPVYNAESTLERCIRSINRGLLPQEIIIVDDASVDGSVLLANKLAKVYSNISLISRSMNGGAADARRDGFRAAECDYVAYVDADDYIEDGALEEAYNTLVETGSDICVWQLWRVKDDRSYEAIDLSKVPFPITGREAVELTLTTWDIPAWGVAKKDVYLKAYDGFSVTSMNADELVTRLAFVNARKVVCSNKRYFYLVNPQSTMGTLNSRHLTVLDSDIWLLGFCGAYGFDMSGTLIWSMGDLWRFFRLRKRLGVQETMEKLRRFTRDVCFIAGFFPGILREGKALLKFILVGLYCRIPFFGNADRV